LNYGDQQQKTILELQAQQTWRMRPT